MQLTPYTIEASKVYSNSNSFIIRRRDNYSSYAGTLMNIIVKELELPNSNTFTIERYSDQEMMWRQHCLQFNDIFL